MPGVYRQPNIANALMAINQRLRAIETQQQATYSNGKGQPIVNTGYIPGSNPAEYGIQFVNPSLTGTGGSGSLNGQIAFFGEDANGNVGLYYYNGSGTKISQYDQTGLHFYDATGHEVVRLDQTGLHVYNDSGTEEVAAGLLNPSPAIYGLGVLPHGGTQLQQVGGFLWVAPPAVNNVTNTAWTDFGSPSSITAEIGPSGEAAVAASSQLVSATSSGGVPGFGVSIDGGATIQLLGGLSMSGIAETFSSTQTVVTGLSAGSHTFQFQYQSANGNQVDLDDNFAIVQPL